MTSKARQTLRQKIELEKRHIEAELITLQDQLQPIAPECALGDLGRNEAIVEQEVLAQRFRLCEARQVQLENALCKIASEDYGICEVCEEAIPLGRLEIMPEALRCARCSE